MAAKKKQIGVAVIGAGGRGQGCTLQLLKDSDRQMKVLSVFDPDPAMSKVAIGRWESPETLIAKSFREAIAVPGVEWVLVFSPNAFHKEHILAGFKAGKHVFSEKPLATTIADCQAIYTAHQKSGKLFATGFVLRFAPLYREAKRILTSGKLGRILSIDANENVTPGHGGYIMTNWRRLTKYAGPHLLEKCCHDLDLINWFAESVPSRVAGFGSLDFFVPKNKKYEAKYGAKMFAAWPDPHKVASPFTSDKDLLDNQVAIMEYRNGIKVQFQATMSNVIPERRMYFSCTEGNLLLELYSSLLKFRALGDDKETIVSDFGGGGHGGGDNVIWKELFQCMVRHSKPKCGGDEGLESAVVALAIDQAMRTGRVIDMEPIWKKLNR
jgi:predicted dehydrogenase